MKINSYTLLDKTKNEMVNVIGMSIKYKIEYGSKLCLNNNKEIRLGKLCKGEKCSIQSSEFTCDKHEKSVGIFHTHDKNLDPSVSDLAAGYMNGMNCIGSFEGIRCFKRKFEDFNALDYANIRLLENRENLIKLKQDKWKLREISTKEYKEDIEKYKKDIDKLVNSYFNIINIL